MTYDANGNLNKNLHKNVSTITYNHLNLPTVITFTSGNTIELLYDATGSKLRKTVKVGGVVQYVQDYLGGMEYRQTGAGVKRVESVFHDEGRYYNTNVDASNTLSWRREYNFRDHLGNTRLVFTDRNGNGVVDITGTASTSDVLQENHYYAFGMAFEGAWLQNDPAVRDNKYQYNGKELNDDFGLNWNDYGARWYDAAIGRFTGVDPLADKYTSWSPYTYTFNNPIIFIDPDGRSPETVKPESQAALDMIKNTLTKADAQFVRLDNSGNIDRDFLNSNTSSSSGNFASLQTLVNSETMITVELANSFTSSDSDGNLKSSDMPYMPADEYSDRDLDGSTMSGTSTGESGFLGKTLFPDKEGLQNSPTSELKIIVNSGLSPKGQAEIYSHEANGHAKIYIQTNGDRNAASHQPVGMRETNNTLVNEIVKSKQETIINMKQQ